MTREEQTVREKPFDDGTSEAEWTAPTCVRRGSNPLTARR